VRIEQENENDVGGGTGLSGTLPPGHGRGMPHDAETDHERAAHAHQVAIYRAMTPQQRLEQAFRLNRMMRKLMAIGFRERNPEWTEARVQRAVADRILYARTG
jgi:hypothetical protein